MPRGGKRPGAGRKPGSKNARTAAVARKATAEGIQPIEVMLHAMRLHFAAGEYDAAATIAKDAAPYCHPRLASLSHEHSGKGGGPIPFTFVEVPRARAGADRGSDPA